jgi:hemoglobin/transferrin/lactoferrin receptor protein
VISSIRYDSPSNTWGVELAGTYAAQKDDIDFLSSPDQFVPDSYYSLDLIAYGNLTKFVTVNAGLYNLTDQHYYIWQNVVGLPVTRTDIGRFAEPGIYAKAGVTIRF